MPLVSQSFRTWWQIPIGKFSFLFIIVWWAWFNGTTYHDLHGNNDIRTRIFTFLQMTCVVAMAVFAHNALREGSKGFASSHVCFQFVLTILWWLYFDFVSHRIPHPGILTVSLWFYLHLPTTVGSTTVGATILNVIEHTGNNVPVEVRRLLVTSLVVILISITFEFFQNQFTNSAIICSW